jgi:dTDP-4-dehydrorhamnose reductase
VGRDPSIHVTGAGGQVGIELAQLLPGARLHSHGDLDVTDAQAVNRALEGAEIVVHLAAFTNVDECEADRERAFSVNARGTEHVVQAAGAGCRVVYVSTDYVFDGIKRGEYVPDDPPSPINVYGESKAAGERAVLESSSSLVVRTSWVYGHGRNFVATILSAARAGKELRIVADQVGRPTWARDLAYALQHLITAEARGIVHVAGAGDPCTWADLAEEALGGAGLPRSVERVTTETYASIAGRPMAPRPPNSALSIDAARALGTPLRDWREAVGAYVREAS